MMADINIGPEVGGVPGGSGGAVRIPVLPTVSTPLRDAPPISRWRGAGIPETVPVQTQDIFEGIENAGEKIGRILAAQGKNQRALQLNQLTSDYANTDKMTRASAAANGSYIGTADDNMVGLYKQGMGDSATNILKDPANQGLLADPVYGPQLRQRLIETQNNGTAFMTAHMTGVAHDDQEKNLQGQMKTGAISIGADYRIGPDGNVIDGPDALQKTQHVVGLIHGMKGHLPGEEAADMQTLSLHIASERAQAIAQDTGQPFLLDKFIKQQPAGTFMPEQLNHFHEMQRGAIKAPYEQAMAVNDAKVGAALNELNRMQDAHDPNLAAAAYKAEPLIGSEKTKSYVGESYHPPRTPETPSQPGAVESWIKDVTANPLKYSSQDITAIDKDIMTTADKSKVHAALYDAQQAVKKPLGAAYMNGRRQIRDALTPTIDPFPAETKKKVDEALEDYDTAYRGGAFQTVQDATDGRDNVLKAYGAKKPVPPPRYVADPKKVAPTLTPGQIAAGVKAARANGFAPAPGPISAPSAAPAPTATPAAAAESGGW